MVRIGPMASEKFLLNRRELMAGLGAAALTPIWPAPGCAQGRPSLALLARAGSLALRAGGPDTPVWALEGPDLRFKRGDIAEVAFGNEIALPTILNWRGIDGVAAVEPLTVRAPLAADAREALQLPLRHAGTLLCDLGLLGDGQARRPHPGRRPRGARGAGRNGIGAATLTRRRSVDARLSARHMPSRVRRAGR